jgi:acyl carrier protein
MMELIEQRITQILQEEFKVDPGFTGTGATFADLGFDSLVIVELALALDNEFGIALSDGELTDTMTITDAAQLLTVKGAVR